MPNSTRRRVIGFLASAIDDPYQNAVWSGAAEEAARMGLSLVFHGGQRVSSTIGVEALDSLAFDLAGQSYESALIVLTNVLGLYVSYEELGDFFKRLASKPLISAGLEYPGIPWVGIQNQGGMRAVAEHLVLVHGRRRFLFLAGPRGHAESEARKEEFLGSLSELGLDPSAARLEYCDFQEAMARSRLAAFLDSGGVVDAVVAANDRMALGAMRALDERGLEVPGDVSVTGFDDNEECRYALPPLTTVHQPTSALGRCALRRAASLLSLPGVSEEESPCVSFVIRESCGCPNPVAAMDDISAAPPPEAGRDFLLTLSRRVNREIAQGRNPMSLRDRDWPASIRERALLILAEGEARYHAQRLAKAEREAATLRGIEASLVSSFALEDILESVASGSRALGISGCWLVLFEQGQGVPAGARLAMAYGAGRVSILPREGAGFPTTDLLPGGLPANWSSYVCEPLRFGRERLGYLIMTADAQDRNAYRALRDQASSALKGATLMGAERGRERALAGEVRKRTRELAASNVQLREEMAERKALERELIQVSNRIMQRIGMDIHDDLCQDIAGMGLMAAAAEASLRRSGAPEAEAMAALVKAAGETAARAKAIARALYPADIDANGLLPALERLVQAAAERTGSRVELQASPDFGIHEAERAIHVYRIVQEALNNAVRHSKASVITVRLAWEEGSMVAEVRDNGIGFEAAEAGADNEGMGIKILKYRASVLGAQLRISRAEGGGTLVSCRLEG